MAYLNCPLCPSQAVPANTQDAVARFGFGLVKMRCIGSGHTFYIEEEELDERQTSKKDVTV
jgi:hypothetical protein